MIKVIEMAFMRQTCVDPRNYALVYSANWRHLVNTDERLCLEKRVSYAKTAEPIDMPFGDTQIAIK